MARALAVGFLLLLILGIDSALACSVPYIRTFNDQTVDGQMTARSGRPCSIRMRHSAGPTSGATIVQRPSSGTVTIGSGQRITYRSRPGFVGSDSFTYARHGLDRYNNRVTRTIRVAVRVTP
jgi:hypothetical protein